jgi:fatty-acyl-CoA synthase
MNVPLTVGDFAYRARTVHPDRLAVVDEPDAVGALGTLTYGELLRRADGMIAALDALGVAVGERVAIVSPNCAKFLIALFAVTGSGRVLVPINFRLGADEVRFIVEDAEASVLLVDAELDAALAGVGARHRIVLDGEADAELFAPGDELAWPTLDETDPATINYTSGTTSVPKGVVLTHRNHWLNAVTLGWQLGLGETDRYLHTLPLFHVNGWGMPLATAAMGVANVIQRTVRGPEVLRRVEREGVTLLCGAAAVAATITEAAEGLRAAGEAVPGAGRVRMVSGGSATPAAVIERFEAATGWEMIHAYGLTESAPVLTANRISDPEGRLSPAERAERLTSAGPPLVGVRLAISPDGELLARAGKVFAGYWRRPDLTDEVVEGEWLRTGDGGELIDGSLRITDRKKDVIVTGGENVSSLEVEACLFQHPAVQDAAIIGVPHERWQETPKALVVLRDGQGVSEAELIAFCRERLAGFKCPTSVEFRDELPRTATGKVKKFVLRAEYWDAE